MKTWLKGGLIGILISIILMSTMLFEVFNISRFNLFTDSQNNPYYGLYGIFNPQCKLLMGCGNYGGCMSCIFITPVLVLIEFFIIGAIIGLIFGKIKSRGENK